MNKEPTGLVPRTRETVVTTGLEYRGEIPGDGYEGRIEDWKERFPEERIVHYKSGGSGGIYKGWDAKKNRVVGIKELAGNKEGADIEFQHTGAEQRDNIVEMISLLGDARHPGIMPIYGYYEIERRGLKHPQLVFKLHERPSLLDKINGPASEENVREFLLSGGLPLHHLHTSKPGEPIFHRDVKPDNYLVMPEDAEWPHTLVDLGSVGIGERETMKGSRQGTLSYAPHKQIALGKVNEWTEYFALIRSAIHLGMGKRFDEVDLDHTDIRTLGLNYSNKLLDVFATTTTQDESKGYHDFLRLMSDLGYNTSRVPETRQELEAILGHRSLSARVETQSKPEVVVNTNSDLPEVVDNGDGTFTILGKTFKDNGNFRKNLLDIHQGMAYVQSEIDGEPHNFFSVDGKDNQGNERVLAYTQHMSQKHPILQEALDGKSLESIIKNTKRADEWIDKWAENKAKNFEEITGVKDDGHYLTVVGMFGWLVIQVIIGAYTKSALLAETTVFGLLPGALLGEAAYNYLVDKKILERSREIDSIIREARVSKKSLEERMNMVELSEEEKEEIRKKSDKLENNTVPIWAGVTVLGGVFGYYFGGPAASVIGFVAAYCGGGALGLPSMEYFKEKSKEYLTNKKIREKRVEHGLPADGMAYRSDPLRIEEEENSSVYRIVQIGETLENLGLKEKPHFFSILTTNLEKHNPHLESEYFGKGIRVKCKQVVTGSHLDGSRLGAMEPDLVEDYSYDVVVEATSEEKAKPVIEALRKLELPKTPLTSDAKTAMLAGHGELSHEVRNRGSGGGGIS